MTHPFRHSICNEIYQGWDFAAACHHMRGVGYEGIEIAPFTLAEEPASISSESRREYRDIIRNEGLQFVGLHWLMVSPKGLHVTTPDAALRARSWEHIRHLVDLSSDLSGSSSVMVFGSPVQRGTTGGSTREEATDRFVDGLQIVATHAAERGVTILVEALPKNQCNVITSLAEAVSIVQQVSSPGVATMFDVHNAVDETEPHDVLVRRYFEYIRHIHVNEIDGRHCGAGDYDFSPLLAALKDLKYAGWISLEAFDFKPGAERIATESIQHLSSLTRMML